MIDAFGASPHDYPGDVELGLDPCGERFLEDRTPPMVAARPCLQCGGAEHYHCRSCQSASCHHVLTLVRYLFTRPQGGLR